MLIHDFYQVSPQIVAARDEDGMLDYILKHRNELRKMSVSDKVVLLNLGRTDTKGWHVLELEKNQFARGKMRYFSAFTAVNPFMEMKIIGICYYGETIMNHETLKELIDHPGHVRLRDIRTIRRFRAFCEDALKEGKWIVHEGV